MRPAHEQLGGNDRSDSGLGEQRGPGGVSLKQGHQFGVEFVDLC
jgi:hypothetical protein